MHPCKSHTASTKEYTSIHVLTHWKHTYDNRKHTHILTGTSEYCSEENKFIDDVCEKVTVMMTDAVLLRHTDLLGVYVGMYSRRYI